jgi:hypothetical protein
VDIKSDKELLSLISTYISNFPNAYEIPSVRYGRRRGAGSYTTLGSSSSGTSLVHAAV